VAEPKERIRGVIDGEGLETRIGKDPKSLNDTAA